MDLLGVLPLDELSHGLANLSMFPYFDMAHYIISVMALREQPGKWRKVFLDQVLKDKQNKWMFCTSLNLWNLKLNSDNKPQTSWYAQTHQQTAATVHSEVVL